MKKMVMFLVMVFIIGCGGGGGEGITWKDGYGSSSKFIIVNDMRLDGEDVGIRIFDAENMMRWPEDELMFILSDYTINYTTIDCIYGAELCLGAINENGDTEWGVGIDYTNSNADACTICDGGSYNFTLY